MPNKRGGKRPGAGPPKKDPAEKKIQKSFKLCPEVVQIVEAQGRGKQGPFVDKAVLHLVETCPEEDKRTGWRGDVGKGFQEPIPAPVLVEDEEGVHVMHPEEECTLCGTWNSHHNDLHRTRSNTVTCKVCVRILKRLSKAKI